MGELDHIDHVDHITRNLLCNYLFFYLNVTSIVISNAIYWLILGVRIC